MRALVSSSSTLSHRDRVHEKGQRRIAAHEPDFLRPLEHAYTYPCSTSTSLPLMVSLTILGGSGAGIAWRRAALVDSCAVRNIAADILVVDPATMRDGGTLIRAALNEHSIVVTVFLKQTELSSFAARLVSLPRAPARVPPANHPCPIGTHSSYIFT